MCAFDRVLTETPMPNSKNNTKGGNWLINATTAKRLGKNLKKVTTGNQETRNIFYPEVS